MCSLLNGPRGSHGSLGDRALTVPTPFRDQADTKRRKKSRPSKAKKNDVVEHPEVFDHVGLLVNEPPGMAGMPFI